MTDFPTAIADTGYVLPGHLDPAEARPLAAAWLTSDRDIPSELAQQLADEAPVSPDCWWSNATPDGFAPGAEAGFVPAEYPQAQPVTVVALSWQYVGGAG